MTAQPKDRPPRIHVDADGVRYFLCPPCDGLGAVWNETRDESVSGGLVSSRRAYEACKHCFGFGRLPCPSWYREQVKP